MSIPFFFEPVTFPAYQATVKIPCPDGGTIDQVYAAGEVTFVDGGMLQNFPITAFDRADGAPPRWPTIGVKLSSLPTQWPPTKACQSALAVGIHCVRTMMNEWDNYQIDAATAARTIFVDNAGVNTTDFDLTSAQQNELFANGVNAATKFVMEMAAVGHVPRSAEESRQHVLASRGPILSPSTC
jgi:NTE family protein